MDHRVIRFYLSNHYKKIFIFLYCQNGEHDNDKTKKEIIRKIIDMDKWIVDDMELGCGFAAPVAYADMEEETEQLYEGRAHLRHYKNTSKMFYDERGL